MVNAPLVASPAAIVPSTGFSEAANALNASACDCTTSGGPVILMNIASPGRSTTTPCSIASPREAPPIPRNSPVKLTNTPSPPAASIFGSPASSASVSGARPNCPRQRLMFAARPPPVPSSRVT
ncbi:MAG: hypothetical protein BWZ08_01788 [candidate division BRC1 bacterium ADurb.BinA292]|nr:MAG: hypothetical protein BWZ08_01788 [candidate division BRC1 bacterium ADurb.BinA292]